MECMFIWDWEGAKREKGICRIYIKDEEKYRSE